jgi:competence protein ComEC
MGGLHALLDNFDVSELWVGQNPLVPEYVNILKTALRHSVPIRVLMATDSMVFHSAHLEFLNPIAGSNRASTPSNNDSLAFRLQWGNRRFLLTGDIERRIEAQLLQNNKHISAEVLKVAHHGSRSSTSSEFVDSVNPLWALISVSENSPFGHPHAEVMERLDERKISVFRTDRDGAITVTTDGNKLEVQTFVSRI